MVVSSEWLPVLFADHADDRVDLDDGWGVLEGFDGGGQVGFFSFVGHDQKSGVLFSAFFLADGTERNAVGSKDFGEFGKHPDDVDDGHVDVESGGDVTEIGDGQVGVGGFAGGAAAEYFVPAGAHNVAEDGGCGGVVDGDSCRWPHGTAV